MYCTFYGFKEPPFNVTADPAFFFLSKEHEQALAHLTYGISQRKGIAVITGEIGTGKTTLCRYFLNQLGRTVKTAVILNPSLSELELIEAIVTDFGIKCTARSKVQLIEELNRFLIREARSNPCLIIDEAQNLQPSHLEQVRLLSNLETEKEKLLQIVLVGQPELNEKLDLHELRQLRQRIMVRYHIVPLSGAEVSAYIQFRLGIASQGAQPAFTDDAIREIAAFSGGIPRLINIICDRALLAGFVAQEMTITGKIVQECRKELEYLSPAAFLEGALPPLPAQYTQEKSL